MVWKFLITNQIPVSAAKSQLGQGFAPLRILSVNQSLKQAISSARASLCLIFKPYIAFFHAAISPNLARLSPQDL